MAIMVKDPSEMDKFRNQFNEFKRFLGAVAWRVCTHSINEEALERDKANLEKEWLRLKQVYTNIPLVELKRRSYE